MYQYLPCLPPVNPNTNISRPTFWSHLGDWSLGSGVHLSDWSPWWGVRVIPRWLIPMVKDQGQIDPQGQGISKCLGSMTYQGDWSPWSAQSCPWWTVWPGHRPLGTAPHCWPGHSVSSPRRESPPRTSWWMSYQPGLTINENIKPITNLPIKSLKFTVRFCIFWVHGWSINALIFHLPYDNFFFF